MADETSATSQSYRGFEDLSQGGADSGRPAFDPQPSAAALSSDPTTSRTNLLAASPPPRRANDAFIPQLPTQAETSGQKMKRRAKSAVGKTAGGMVKNVKKVWTDAPSKHELLEFSRQTWIEVKSRKVSSCLGICACLLVVFVLALLASILSYAPVIFLKLAEGDAGQIDLSLEAASGTRNTSLQYAATTAQFALYSEDAARTSPRIILDMLAYGFDCSNVYDPFNLTQLYTGPDQADPTFPASCGVRKASGKLYVADQLREEFAGIGTAFPFPDTIPRGHAVLHSSIFNTLGLRGVGDTFVLSIKPQDDLLRQWRPLSNNTVSRWLHLPLVVAGTFSKAKGKFDTASTNVLMELADLMKTVGEFAGPAFLNQSVRDEISLIDPYSVSSYVYANMPPDRAKPYISSDFTKVRQKLVRWASPLIYYAGITQVSADLPVAEKVESYQFFALFLGLLLNLIAIILLALCSMLIGSLLLVSVETRTFQMGVLRMLGMTRYGAIILILMQAYLYAIPGYILGLIFAGLTYFGITRVFKSLLNVTLPPTLSGFAIGLATLAGLVIPILAAILPIRQALRKNLHDALDTRRSKVHAVAYKLTRSDGDDFSWTIIAVGSALSLFGFLIYYILPLALLSSNFALLLNIFFFIILGMLLGLVLLALNLQPILERYFAKLVFFWENAGVRTLLVKNMIAHRTRNRKTTLMYSLALAFIIFITSSYQLQATSFVYAEQQAHGGYIAIEASDTSGGIVNRVPSIAKLEAALAADPDVSGWAYETVQLSDLLDNVDDVLVTNLGHTYTDKQPLYAVSPNFFNTVLSGFVRTANQLGSFSLLDTVYSAIGSSGLVLGQTYHKQVGARVNQDVLLQWTERNESIETVQETDRYTRLRCLALMNAGAVVRWSKYPIVLGQDAVMSLPTYLRMLQVAEERQQNFDELGRLYNSIEDLPMSRLIIKFRASGIPSSDTRKRITRELNDVIAGAPGVTIYDYNDAIDPIRTGNQIIGLMFAITTAIAMLICFFSLSSSMLTNINEQSKEIGVLRALGLKRFSLRRAYVYEAWVILITSSATGILVGVVVAWTMGLQQVLFTQLPIPFTFPWLVTAVIFGLSLVLAVLSSLGPVNRILRLPVVQILRLLN